MGSGEVRAEIEAARKSSSRRGGVSVSMMNLIF